MARHEIWIISDNDGADKMLKFHQLKNLADTDLAIRQWYLFAHFDTYTQTAKSTGNAFSQLENCLLKTMQERPRPPHSIVFILGDEFLDDRKLSQNPDHLYYVLHKMAKQLKRQVLEYVDKLPDKAKPMSNIRLFITKPLPKPEKFFKNRMHIFQKLAKARHTYNDKLIAVVHGLNMNFINPRIQPTNGRAFVRTRINNRDKFILTPEGLHQFWYSLSASLEKLHRGLLRGHASDAPEPDTNDKFSQQFRSTYN